MNQDPLVARLPVACSFPPLSPSANQEARAGWWRLTVRIQQSDVGAPPSSPVAKLLGVFSLVRLMPDLSLEVNNEQHVHRLHVRSKTSDLPNNSRWYFPSLLFSTAEPAGRTDDWRGVEGAPTVENSNACKPSG